MPIAGNTAATFANPSGGSTVSGNNWFYDGRDGVVTFSGTSFSGSTPSSFNLGLITLRNFSNQGNGVFTADLDLLLTFTTPVGATVSFADGLQLTAQPGNGDGHGDSLELDFGGFPGPKSFTVGNETYTVSYDGFFDSAANNNTPLASLFVANSPGGTASAFLWGTITATDPASAAIPEPASILLLGTVGVLVAGLGRRRFFRRA
jgi:hypothetical protein